MGTGPGLPVSLAPWQAVTVLTEMSEQDRCDLRKNKNMLVHGGGAGQNAINGEIGRYSLSARTQVAAVTVSLSDDSDSVRVTSPGGTVPGGASEAVRGYTESFNLDQMMTLRIA